MGPQFPPVVHQADARDQRPSQADSDDVHRDRHTACARRHSDAAQHAAERLRRAYRLVRPAEYLPESGGLGREQGRKRGHSARNPTVSCRARTRQGRRDRLLRLEEADRQHCGVFREGAGGVRRRRVSRRDDHQRAEGGAGGVYERRDHRDHGDQRVWHGHRQGERRSCHPQDSDGVDRGVLPADRAQRKEWRGQQSRGFVRSSAGQVYRQV
mmetsp:Transcript_7973/g.12308  ORF Transcript_7973/g.12308 Transcript_7973/m.12308 type:complete len:212 (-) Transcript_7973:818-1453(-)